MPAKTLFRGHMVEIHETRRLLINAQLKNWHVRLELTIFRLLSSCFSSGATKSYHIHHWFYPLFKLLRIIFRRLLLISKDIALITVKKCGTQLKRNFCSDSIVQVEGSNAQLIIICIAVIQQSSDLLNFKLKTLHMRFEPINFGLLASWFSNRATESYHIYY